MLPYTGRRRHPYYYGQLERQNREHRAWQQPLALSTRAELRDAGEVMRTALNELWARPYARLVHGRGGVGATSRRSTSTARELRTEVERRTSGLVNSGLELLVAQRIATEAALIKKTATTITPGRLSR